MQMENIPGWIGLIRALLKQDPGDLVAPQRQVEDLIRPPPSLDPSLFSLSYPFPSLSRFLSLSFSALISRGLGLRWVW